MKLGARTGDLVLGGGPDPHAKRVIEDRGPANGLSNRCQAVNY